ncbi:MAG TPA: VWA domain-containing protein [Bryobacteraceae bacterium]|nr:VWA domain-containing protein [Bryobacteraceae bacterium]
MSNVFAFLRVHSWLILCFSLALAQDATFKSDTKLVIVDLTVRDKSGRPITNLTKDDVELLEDGVRQEIRVFELQKLGGEPLAPISFGATAPKTLEVRTAPATPAKPTVAAPAAGPIRYQDRRLLCMFFDMTSMQPPDQLRAQEAAIKFLQSQMTSSDLVEIMTYTTSIKIVQEWTDDRETLITQLRKLTIGEGSDLADMAATAGDEGDDSGSFAADETEFNIFNTDRKLAALEDAARKLSILPEKKAMIYFSSGIGKTGVENQSQIKATVNAAVRANVAFYPVDARGLVALVPGGDASQASPRGTGIISGSKQQGIRNSFNDSQETLVTIAADTGGKAMLDTNDLTMGIRQAQEDINSYYILGYYSKNEIADGKYRRIEVKLGNKSLNAKLDFRRGYYAAKVWKKFNATDKEQQLQEALTLGDPVNELPLALEVDYFRVARDRYFVPISVKIPGSAVGLTKKGQKETADLDFIGQVRDANGKLVSGVRDYITVKLDEQNAAMIAQRHLQYDAGLTLSAGSYSLRFLARENQSGKMGTFETKFTIPDLASGGKLRLSSVVWSNQKEPVTSAVGSAGNNKKLLAANPLVQGDQRIVPSITRVFRKDQTMYVYFEVYDPTMDPDRKIPSLTAQIDLLAGGRKVYTSPPVRLSKLATARPGVAPFAFQIPLAKLPPGQYVSQVNVIDETGRKFAFPRSEVVLLAVDNTPPGAPK